MISVEESKQLIEASIGAPESITVKTGYAYGRVLAEDIFSPVDLPPFRQAAMDGYGLRYSDYAANIPVLVKNEVKAGDGAGFRLIKGEAIKIFTGALVPDDVDTVVMKEKATENQSWLQLHENNILTGDHIREKGAEIKNGELAIEKGSTITPAMAGFLSAMGITKVKVTCRPSVSLVITGNELQKPGSELEPGKVYESNSTTLCAALSASGISVTGVFYSKDNLLSLYDSIKEASSVADVVLISGGISVGDYDFTRDALEKHAVKTIFYLVNQKPGKPLYFGTKGKKLFFGLPGNPASALTCYYEYVNLAINLLLGKRKPHLTRLMLPILRNWDKKPGISQFLRGYADVRGVTPINEQHSFMLKSFAEANCLIYLPEKTGLIDKGEHVEVHMICQT